MNKKTILSMLKMATIIGISSALITSCNSAGNSNTKVDATQIKVSGTMEAELTAPPLVPKPVGNRAAMKLTVNMEIIEKEGVMADGVKYIYWTFGGSVPGSFIRTRIGDEVEFHLKNHPDNKLPHNIDLHSVTGPGGGAASSFVAPGHEVVFSFKVINQGLYVYHCATAPVGMHIANGMYGLILVEPEGGLPKVDKEYYIMQGDFYTKGANGEKGLQPFDMGKAIKEEPDYVVFNGKVGALTGDNAITAKVGETVRLFVGNGGPNLVSSFHVIGEIFDNVNIEGGSLINHDVQTTLIPAGGSSIVDFKCEVPGTFIIVDHSIFRTFNKGSLGMLKVTGDENKPIYSGKQTDEVYHPEGGTIQNMPTDENAVKLPKPTTLAERIEDGKSIYNKTCFACHQPTGEGLPNTFPPLAKSDYLNADANRAIEYILKGKTGEIVVNGKKYNSVMTAQVLTDDEIANVLTFVYSSWGNSKKDITPAMVAAVRKTVK
ncbi:MAG: copper-containing nitrite reductase [Bacteroidia bacterium]